MIYANRNKFYSNEIALTYDDVQLVPVERSRVKSRNDVTLEQYLDGIPLKFPLITSPMDTVTNSIMAKTVREMGGLGIIHRYQTVEDRIKEIQAVGPGVAVAVAIGLDDSVDVVKHLLEHTHLLALDVANGHSLSVINHVEKLRKELKNHYPNPTLIVGNVATKEGLRDLVNAGSDVVRLGIGNGSICSTRLVTGHGVPSITNIMECRDWLDRNHINHVKLIADGNIKNSGDAAKALAAGAHFVMVGSLVAGTDECPGQVHYMGQPAKPYKVYRGMASFDSQKDWKGLKPGTAPEGISTYIPYKGSVKPILEEFIGGLKSALSYSGAHNLAQFYENSQFIRVTQSGVREASTHIIK